MQPILRQLNVKISRHTILRWFGNYGWKLNIILSVLILWGTLGQKQPVHTEAIPSYVLPDDTYSQDIYQLAQSTTVRIMRENTSGTGVIIDRQEQTYTVLTSWHVVGDTKNSRPLGVMTVDGQTYQLSQPPQRVGNLDLAVIQFQSQQNYSLATLATNTPEIGEKIYAAGFPLYEQDSSADTIALGTEAFRLTQGEISLILPKKLPEGYNLGYTNDTEIGMSGGPIFNTKGFLVGVHGRGKYRDPGFGVYTFEDGSEPAPEMLETMIESSWGIPITAYWQFASQALQN